MQTQDLGFGEIWATSRVRPVKARDDYFCASRGCNNSIRKGEIYYAEYRGSLDSIRRCAACYERDRCTERK